MEYKTLGNTGLQVSQICLGTMTFGEQNTEQEAHEQLSYALDKGINLIDTAELYPIPVRAGTYGATEEYIGNWIKKNKNRDKFILASKIAGPRKDAYHIRGGSKYNKEQIHNALEDSLKRLHTGYIDLYQLHWPERKSNFFGKLGYKHQEDDPWEDNLYEVLQILDELVKKGRIRYIGISNETPWGAMKYLELAEMYNLPRMVSIQNPYNLLNRTFEVGLAEIALRENMGLLAYSPLAFGLLSGKYLNHEPGIENSRLTLYPELKRYNKPEARTAVKEYVNLAIKHGLKPAQMALAFINSRKFLTSTIIGATSMEQLKENVESIDLKLSPQILEEIDAIHISQPNPAP